MKTKFAFRIALILLPSLCLVPGEAGVADANATYSRETEFNLFKQQLLKELGRLKERHVLRMNQLNEELKTLKKEHEGRELWLLELRSLKEGLVIIEAQLSQLEQLKKRYQLLMEQLKEDRDERFKFHWDKHKRLIAPDYLIVNLDS